MTITLTAVTVVVITIISLSASADGLGSGSTVAVSYGTGTVCGILAGKSPQTVECLRGGQLVPIQANFSFDQISGGRNSFCGLRSGGLRLFCWDSGNFSGSSFQLKRIYNGTVGLMGLSVGDDQVCAVENGTGIARCWRGDNFPPSPDSISLSSVTAGIGFACGITAAGVSGGEVRCWSRDEFGVNLQRQFQNFTSMVSLIAGNSHVCGIQSNGSVICRGRNDFGQLNFPSGFGFSSLALGVNRSCGILRSNKTAVCWGSENVFPGSNSELNGTSFESIVLGQNFTCGLLTVNLSLVCWGPDMAILPWTFSSKIVPGRCTEDSCSCGIYPNSENLCSGSGRICNQCQIEDTPPPPPPPPSLSRPPPPPPPPSGSNERQNKGLLAFAIIGSVGAFSGICTIIYCIWTGICCCRHKKIHNSVQPTITPATGNGAGGGAAALGSSSFYSPPSRSSTLRRQSSRMKRQRSGTSSKRDRAEEFSLSELAAATNDFSPANKIGAGSFGTVYCGKLADGREVAIKRGETGLLTKKFQEKESAFQSELAFLSRLHHKHLVGFVGFCEENEERLLVYEYMKNGALYDHLHSKRNNSDRGNSGSSSIVLNSWKMRIKIALDASRGIEYLHTYAVPPIIHRDIKSSNILLDANWTGRVSDFGLSLLGPETEGEYLSMKAAGTVGYMDPEYYGLQQLTAKSDVYGLGVVLLELLTGRRAIFKGEDGGPVSVVDFAVPKIVVGAMVELLDMRVGMPGVNEAEAVELVAYTAMLCVNLEGKDRPTMSDIVANLERALTLCDGSHGSISSAGGISLASE